MSGVAEVGINDDDETVSDTGTNDDNNDDLSSWRGTSSLEAQLVTDDPRMRRRTCSLYYVFFQPFFCFDRNWEWVRVLEGGLSAISMTTSL